MNTLRLLGLMSVLVSVFSCSGGGSTPQTQPETPVPFSAQLVNPTNPADLEARLKAELTRLYIRGNEGSVYYGPGGGPVPAPPGSPGGGPGVFPGGGSASDTSHSDTNVQERGVDEGDLVKTDGTYIYLARGSHFFILLANPASDMVLLSDTDLAERIEEIHLSGSNVTVISLSFGPLVTGNAAPYSPVTRVRSYDVTDPALPVLTAAFNFPGSFQGSRRIGAAVFIVTNYVIDIPDPAAPWDYLDPGMIYDAGAYAWASEQALAENLKKIAASTLDDLLPLYSVTLSAEAGTASTSHSTAAGNIYIPEFGNGTNLSLVVKLDLSGRVPSVAGTAGVLSSWGGVYMSEESLYLTSDNHWLWIEPVLGADMPRANPEPRTAVHKFSVAGTEGAPLYKGSALVDGWVNNRFSMSDYQGYLRIGTTRGGWWGEGISNQLAILAEAGGQLVETGKLTGLAPGERIYSMRFDGDRGYMVTFRQTDPLFTLDLRDPANPRVAGELIVNGFSTYIHLLGPENTRLLTVGRSADSSGQVTGNKLQLFDVTNLAAPTLLDYEELGPGWSDALYDPHAFLYYEPLGILTIPYYTYGATPDSYSSGLNVFNIDPVGGSIVLRGIINAPTVTAGSGSYNYTYIDTVDRSVIIGANIYAMAHRSVTAAGSADLSVIKNVILPESYAYGGVVGPTEGGMALPRAQ
jgi:uncharacterized secreted protein with C-terminal beta-propeller domain